MPCDLSLGIRQLDLIFPCNEVTRDPERPFGFEVDTRTRLLHPRLQTCEISAAHQAFAVEHSGASFALDRA